MKKFLAISLMFLFTPVAYGATYADIHFNEIYPRPLSGSGWVELINTSGSDINLAGWQITHLVNSDLGPTTTAEIISPNIIPYGGLFSFDLNLRAEGDQLFLLDQEGKKIHGVSYGDSIIEATDSFGPIPSLGQSAIAVGGFFGPSDIISRDWFNQTPTRQEILDSLPAGISTNLSTSTDEANNWTSLGNIILSREGFDPVTWTGPHNLTGTAERAELLRLATDLASRVIAPIIPPPSGGGGGGGGGGGSPTVIMAISSPVASSTATSSGLVLGAQTFRFSRMLRPGLRGVDVQELQKILQKEGFFKVKITNYFGPATKQALTLWQKKNKIRPATGVVGKPTLKFLSNLGS
jgi:hypothetical protein